jgi:hypothetical protein
MQIWCALKEKDPCHGNQILMHHFRVREVEPKYALNPWWLSVLEVLLKSLSFTLNRNKLCSHVAHKNNFMSLEN